MAASLSSSPEIRTGLLLALWLPASALPLELAQSPPGVGYRTPAPNVILSVDNSSSMGDNGMNALKAALKETFKPENVPNKSLRVAFQSLNGCNTIPSNAAGCDNLNYMQVLEGAYDTTENSPRGRLLKWIEGLTYASGTPTHGVVLGAGEYLKTTGANSPWNAIPGRSDNSPLACRKAYHVLMTDGGWNAYDTKSIAGTRAADESFDNTVDNIDGTRKVLPDGVLYDPQSAESRVYADLWGRQAVNSGRMVDFLARGDDGYKYWSLADCQQSTKNCKTYTDLHWRTLATSLSDIAFHYWSSDLQPSIPNKVKPNILHGGSETIVSGQKSQTLSEYWNPKNNPATWQHMVHYTIGFNAASSWPLLSTDPKFGTNTFNGDYAALVVGDKKWTNAVQPPITHATDGVEKPPPIYYLDQNPKERYPLPHPVEGVRQQEMWHMALNSRGKFVPAPRPADLVNAFKDLVSSIVLDHTSAVSSYTAAGNSIRTRGTTAYASFYDANGWQGGVRSYTVAQGTGDMAPNPAWGSNSVGRGLSTADKLNSLSATQITNRLILTHNGTQGTAFTLANLNTTQRGLLNRSSHNSETLDTLAETRVNYLRGVRTEEGKGLRTRTSRQGDIVNSAVWYSGPPSLGYNLPGYSAFAQKFRTRTPMLYVGGNDGMLHGFSAANGSEAIAYVPLAVYPYLPNLTNPAYSHRYYVDGSPMTGDVFLSHLSGNAEDKWRTMLVSSLGAGGKGFFVLDVTKPGTTATGGVASNFSAGNAASLVVMDRTDGADADIGHIFGDPVVDEFNSQRALQITQLNNGRWAVVLGNGYNSSNAQPVLLIQYLDGDRTLLKISAAATGPEATGNGLSTPRIVDLNGDGQADFVYAGDLRGNMWKFDLFSSDARNWRVAFNGQPLFTAQHTPAATTPGTPAPTVRQPITTAPVVRINTSVGGMMVAFGTGQNLTLADLTSKAVQSFYSVLDNTHYAVTARGADQGKIEIVGEWSAISQGRAALQARSFNASPISTAADATAGGTAFWNMPESSATTNTAVDYAKGQRGWYLDFPASGERVVRSPLIFSAGSSVLEILSDSPAEGMNLDEERCEPPALAAQAWRTLLGIELGQAPNQQLIDTNADGAYQLANDSRANRMAAPPKEMRLQGPATQIRSGNDSNTRLGDLASPFQTLNWRQFR